MASENNFQTTVESLFKGMDSFITTKTVVGDAITVGDTILPVSYTHLTLPTKAVECRSRWSPYH